MAGGGGYTLPRWGYGQSNTTVAAWPSSVAMEGVGQGERFFRRESAVCRPGLKSEKWWLRPLIIRRASSKSVGPFIQRSCGRSVAERVALRNGRLGYSGFCAESRRVTLASLS